jgi:hypothetical protein
MPSVRGSLQSTSLNQVHPTEVWQASSVLRQWEMEISSIGSSLEYRATYPVTSSTLTLGSCQPNTRRRLIHLPGPLEPSGMDYAPRNSHAHFPILITVRICMRLVRSTACLQHRQSDIGHYRRLAQLRASQLPPLERTMLIAMRRLCAGQGRAFLRYRYVFVQFLDRRHLDRSHHYGTRCRP